MTDQRDDMRDFLIVLRESLLQIVAWIDRRYELPPPTRYRPDHRRSHR